MDLKLTSLTSKNAFIQIFKNMNKFTEFICLNFSDDGLYVEGLDQTKSSIFTLTLNVGWFDKYNTESDLCLNINCNILSKILQTCRDKHELSLNYTDGDNLFVNFKSDDGFNKEFAIPLVDLDDNTISIKEIDCDVEFSIDTKIFADIIDELKMFNDVLNVECDDNHILFHASGIEGSMKCVLYDENNNDNINDFSCVENTKFKKAYSLKFVSIFCNFQKVSKEVNIQFTEDMPLKMTFDVGSESSLVFYLAPMMDGEY